MEIKVLDIDPKDIDRKLLSLNAKKVFDEVRTITYFQNKQDNKEPFLKLTEEGDKLKLSSKVKELDPEIKLFVSRKAECLKLLATLKYLPISRVKARRISYELGSIDLDIDEFPGIPPFLEIDMGANPPITQEKLIVQLGVEKKKREDMTTPEIVNSYGKLYFEMYKISD